MAVGNTVKFYFKSLIYGTLLSGCALYGVIASIVLRLIGKPEYAQYTVARVFYFVISKVLRIKITIKNEEYLNQKPGIVISNHQSVLDVFVLGRLFQPGFTVTAKTALKYFPFLGWFMLASGTFFINRTKGQKARAVLDKALDKVKAENKAIFMFPEGTRLATTKLDLLPFKKGAFHLAQQGGIPVIPCVVTNTSNIFHSKKKVFNCGEIIIEVMKPIPTKDLKTKEEINEFAVDVREKMLSKLQEIGYSSTGAKDSAPLLEDTPDQDESEESIEVEIDSTSTEETPLVDKN